MSNALGMKNKVAAKRPSVPKAKKMIGNGMFTVFIIEIGMYNPECF